MTVLTLADTGAPPIGGGETAATWIIDNELIVRNDVGAIWTRDIEVTSTGRMEWEGMTAYIKGNFYVNGTFTASNCTIYLDGTDFDIRGEVILSNVTLVVNNTFPGDGNIFVRNNGILNITDSLVRSDQSTDYYNWTFETGSEGNIYNTHIYNCGGGNGTNNRGLVVQSSDLLFEGVTFRDNFNHLYVLDADPKVYNCTFYGGAKVTNKEVISAGTSELHIVSSKFNKTNSEVQGGASTLYIDYFVIVKTINNTMQQGVAGSSIDFKDSGGVPVVTVQTDGTGVAQAVQLTGTWYDLSTWGSGNASMNPHNLVASDPWNDIQPSLVYNMNVNTYPKSPEELIFYTFTFNFKPKITYIEPTITVKEDEIKQMAFSFHDRDYGPPGSNPAELTITINSTAIKNVTYNPQAKTLYFVYYNGAPRTSVVNVKINDSDGNEDSADINVTFNKVNDQPDITLPVPTFDVWEDQVKYIPITIVDVDHDVLTEVTVGTNSTQSIEYLTNGSLKILYENDFGPDLAQDNIEVWANDPVGNSSERKKTKMLITFHQTPDAPVITKSVDVEALAGEIEEDEKLPIKIDLSTYWQDDDYDADPSNADLRPFFYVTGNDTASIKVSETTFEMEITPFPDANGKDMVTLYLEDNEELQDSIIIWVNITSINDEPFVQDASFTPSKREAGEFFTFNVYYWDVENEKPTKINLKIDKDEYEMTEVSGSDSVYSDGKEYTVDVQLFTEDHDYRFVVNDGHGDVTSTEVFTTNWPKIINVLRIAEKWNVNNEFLVRIGYFSKAGGEITINENPTAPSNKTYPIEYTDIGFFFGVSTTIQNIQWVHLMFDLDKANVTDIFVTMTEMQLYYYDAESNNWNKTFGAKNNEVDGKLNATADLTIESGFLLDFSSEIIIAPLGPEDVDVDGDGVFNDEDEFPFDPKEWEDSDKDGYGDNGDKFPYDPSVSKDKDGDGAPDAWNPGYSASTVNSNLYLDEYINDSDCTRDFDNDGDCDEIDDDDDGDGMVDLFELNYPEFLDPYDASDASEDQDGDGYTNKEEYDYDSSLTDPLDNPDLATNGGGVFADMSMNVLIAIIVIIVLLVVVAAVFLRKPKPKVEETPPQPPVQPPAPVPPMEQPPMVPPVQESVELEGVEAPPELPVEGVAEAPAEEGVTEEAVEGTEYVVDESQGESMVPESGDIEPEAGETEETADDDEFDDADDEVSEDEFDDIEE